ncbi:MAG: hypothetical protein V4649_10045 [Bacteroidota bacterium]
MYYRKLVAIPALLLGTLSAEAQSLADAYNLSNLTVQGTARSMGFGNALGSVGADFSTLSVNPAGIGVYRSSEFTLTPSLRINGAEGQYIAGKTADNNVNFNINNFGMVFTSAPKGKRYERRSWKAVSFGFGMNRVADFNRRYSYNGVNNTSSATQAFESDANQYNTTDLDLPGYIGYQAYLLNQDTGNRWVTSVPFAGGINQMKNVRESGRINEYTLSLGGNYKERLMLGATVGLTDLRYRRRSLYTESLATGNNAPNPYGFNWFSYNQAVDLEGGGANLKIGAIYKITNFFRIGAAFHTPTIYGISDTYVPEVRSSHNNNLRVLDIGNELLAQNNFNYSFASPWRGILSATFIVKGLGFITADYEYVDYASMSYMYPEDYSYDESVMNSTISSTYQGTSNFRLGAEALLTKYFMARAGFGYYGNPYKVGGGDAQRMDFSAGLGFHFENFFTDVAVVHSRWQMVEQPYNIDFNYVYSGPSAMLPSAAIDLKSTNIAWTIGMKF